MQSSIFGVRAPSAGWQSADSQQSPPSLVSGRRAATAARHLFQSQRQTSLGSPINSGGVAGGGHQNQNAPPVARQSTTSFGSFQAQHQAQLQQLQQAQALQQQPLRAVQFQQQQQPQLPQLRPQLSVETSQASDRQQSSVCQDGTGADSDHDEGCSSCCSVAKKLLVSLALCTALAICWLLIIHTLKWITIRGNDATLDMFAREQSQLLAATSPALATAAVLAANSEFDAADFPAGATDPPAPAPPTPPTALESVVPLFIERRRAAPSGLFDDAPQDDTDDSSVPHNQHKPIINQSQQQHQPNNKTGQRLRIASQHQPIQTTLNIRNNQHNNDTTQPIVATQSYYNTIETQASHAPLESDESGAETAPIMFRAPFFTSWFISIWNIFFMPIFTIISSCCARGEDSATKKILVKESISQFLDNGLTTVQFLCRCAFFSVLWMATVFGLVCAMATIDATVVMALYACSAPLSYLLSWVLLHKQFVGVRIVAVIICTTGIALLAYMDNSRILGSVLIVAGSALCAAIYKVMYQRMFGFWSIAQMSLFFTFIGLFNAFLMWPIALLLYFLGIEIVSWRYIPWLHLLAAGVLNLLANVIMYFGPICSYNVFLDLGLLIAVVLSAVIDVNYYKIQFSGMKLAGVLLLMLGFLICLLPDNWNEFLYDLGHKGVLRWKKRRSLKKSRNNKVQDLSTGQISRLRTPSGRVK